MKIKINTKDHFYPKIFMLLSILIIMFTNCNNDKQPEKNKIIYVLKKEVQDTIYYAMKNHFENFKNETTDNRIRFFMEAIFDNGRVRFYLNAIKESNINYQSFKYILENTNRFLKVKDSLVPILFYGDYLYIDTQHHTYWLNGPDTDSHVFVVDDFGRLSSIDFEF